MQLINLVKILGDKDQKEKRDGQVDVLRTMTEDEGQEWASRQEKEMKSRANTKKSKKWSMPKVIL